MEPRRLGTSELSVPPIVFGAWAIGGWTWGGSDDDAAVEAIHASLAAGATALDTAPMYGFGRSERVLGRALRGRRGGAQVLTKVGLRWDDDRGARFFETDGPDGQPVTVYRNLRPDSVKLEVERSLARLETGFIDLLQCHWPDPTTPVEETMGALADLVEEGVVGAVGVSNFDPGLLERAQRALADRGLPLASNQPRFSLLDREIEDKVLPWCRRNQVGSIVYSPLEQGLLTGKVTLDRAFPDDDQRAHHPHFSRDNRARVLAALDTARELAEAHGATLAQLALAWTVAQPGITAAIVGARTAAQAEENAAAGRIALSEGEVRMLGALFGEVELDRG